MAFYAITICIVFSSMMDAVYFAMSLLDQRQMKLEPLFSSAVCRVVGSFDDLLGGEQAWAELYAAPKLQKLVVRCATRSMVQPVRRIENDSLHEIKNFFIGECMAQVMAGPVPQTMRGGK